MLARNAAWIISLILSLSLFVGSFGLIAVAQDAPKGPQKKVEKKEPVLEDCLARAMQRAKKEDSRWTQASSRHNQGGDTLVVFFEYANGDLAIFEGDEDPANDKYVLVDHDNLPCLEKCVERGKNVIR